MNKHNSDDAANLSMLDLFRVESENQAAILTSGLLELERGQGAPRQLEMLMRAAHSLKGAARIVNLQAAVRVAHAMEDCFALAQQGKLALRQPEIDLLFRGVDLLLQISKATEANITCWDTDHADEIREFLNSLASLTPAAEALAPAVSQITARPEPAAPGSPTGTYQPGESSLPTIAGAGVPGAVFPGGRRAQTRNTRTRGAAHGREPESAAGPGGRVAGRIALAASVR